MKKIVLILLLLTNLCFSQVGINTTNPHVSAELDVTSSSRGLLVPRLTSAAVTTLSSTASEGLIVFNTTTKQFLGYDGSKWQTLGNVPVTVVFASWEVFGFVGGGTSPLAATVTNQISSAVLQRGTGLGSGPGGTTDAWGGNNFNSIDAATAVSNADFFTATITLPSTANFSFSRISANNIRKSTTGASTIQWQYSTNGTTFFDIGSPINLLVDGAVGNNVPEINLSDIPALQNLSNTTITFRLLGFGPSATGGTMYFNDIPGKDIEIIGSYH